MIFKSLEEIKQLEEKLFSYYITYYNKYNKRNQLALNEVINWVEKNIQLSPDQFWDKLTLNLDVKKIPSIANLNSLKAQGKFYAKKNNNQIPERPWMEADVVAVAHTLDKTNLPGHLKHSFLNWAETCLHRDQENDSHKKFTLQKQVIAAGVKATGQVKSAKDLFDK